MIYNVTVKVTAPIYDTEVDEKVKETILNIFPDADVEVQETQTGEITGEGYSKEVVGVSHSVERFRELVERQKIKNTTRKVLSESLLGDVINFKLKKQAAHVEKLNFDVGGHELGAINVRMESNNPRQLIDYITSGTKEDSDAG